MEEYDQKHKLVRKATKNQTVQNPRNSRRSKLGLAGDLAAGRCFRSEVQQHFAGGFKRWFWRRSTQFAFLEQFRPFHFANAISLTVFAMAAPGGPPLRLPRDFNIPTTPGRLAKFKAKISKTLAPNKKPAKEGKDNPKAFKGKVCGQCHYAVKDDRFWDKATGHQCQPKDRCTSWETCHHPKRAEDPNFCYESGHKFELALAAEQEIQAMEAKKQKEMEQRVNSFSC